MDTNKDNKPLYKRWWLWPLAVIVLIIIIAAATGGRPDDSYTAGNTVSPNASPQTPASLSPSPPVSAALSPVPPTTISADFELTSGNYTAGTDFPAGEYDITAVSGSGNVASGNMFSGGLNAMMGTTEANKTIGSDIYEQQYSNIKLPDGVVLSVSGGVVIRITSDRADPSPLKPRIQTNTETVELGNGNFKAGTDFPAGTYDVVAVSGSGNVSSDNMFSGGLNAVMGPNGANKESGGLILEAAYQNIELPDGTTLSIDGAKIRLIPSK